MNKPFKRYQEASLILFFAFSAVSMINILFPDAFNNYLSIFIWSFAALAFAFIIHDYMHIFSQTKDSGTLFEERSLPGFLFNFMIVFGLLQLFGLLVTKFPFGAGANALIMLSVYALLFYPHLKLTRALATWSGAIVVLYFCLTLFSIFFMLPQIEEAPFSAEAFSIFEFSQKFELFCLLFFVPFMLYYNYFESKEDFLPFYKSFTSFILTLFCSAAIYMDFFIIRMPDSDLKTALIVVKTIASAFFIVFMLESLTSIRPLPYVSVLVSKGVLAGALAAFFFATSNAFYPALSSAMAYLLFSLLRYRIQHKDIFNIYTYKLGNILVLLLFLAASALAIIVIYEHLLGFMVMVAAGLALFFATSYFTDEHFRIKADSYLHIRHPCPSYLSFLEKESANAVVICGFPLGAFLPDIMKGDKYYFACSLESERKVIAKAHHHVFLFNNRQLDARIPKSDMIICLNVLARISSADGLIVSFNNCLKKEGQLIIVNKMNRLRAFDAAGLAKRLSAAGFDARVEHESHLFSKTSTIIAKKKEEAQYTPAWYNIGLVH